MKRLKYMLMLGVVLIAEVCCAEVEHLRCEYLRNPLGIDATSPRLSWIITSNRRGEKQTAYQILVASSMKLLKESRGDLWDSGKVVSDQTAQICCQGRPLLSRQQCFWKVRIWHRNGNRSCWSQAARWEMGLLNSDDWSAKWITAKAPVPPLAAELIIHHATYGTIESNDAADVTATVAGCVKENRLILVANDKTLGGDPANNQPKRLHVDYEIGGKLTTKEIDENETFTIPAEQARVPYLRKTFGLGLPIKRAVLFVTALGLYEVRINGQRVGDHVLAPGWTDYRKRVRYQAYEVTTLLKRGQNVMAAILANGWYSGRIGGGNQFLGRVPAFLAQLEVTYADGRGERIVTDASWKTHPSPILSSDFYGGEDYDARLEIKGWDEAAWDDSQWVPAKVRAQQDIALDAQVMEPVREICEIKPKSVTEPKPGCWVFDLGQNMVGVVRLKVSAPSGTKVTLRHAEMLNADGTLYTRNLGGAASVDHYICKGQRTEVWQPRFTFHGFRYVEVSGLAAKPRCNAVTGIVIASDVPRVGAFACSDARVNQLQSNIQWGQRGNYLSIPTDCPQRDERLGWMGDAQAFVRTATYNADVAAFFSKWLVDVDDGQSPEGSFSDVSPNCGSGGGGTPGWGDAGVICPWTIYQAYGDKRVLKRHLPAMIKWVEYLRLRSEGLIRERDRGNDYGDWLSIGADTPKDLIGTAFFAYSTHLVANACEVIGRAEEAAKYEKLFQDIKAAFNQRYVAADGRIRGNTQTAYAMALKFDLLPQDLRPKAAEYLERDINAKGGHLSTGFLGVGYLLPVLTQSGKADTAYRLLLQDTFPSWLFPVSHGATTIWERWDGWTPEKGFQDPSMNSFNHYSLGSCGEYLFGCVGGIRPASPGFNRILIEPAIGDGLTWARTSYDSIHGRIATDWKLNGRRLALKVVVPVNTTATICVPATDAARVTESGTSAGRADGVRFVRQEKDKAIFEVGSGTYSFASEL